MKYSLFVLSFTFLVFFAGSLVSSENSETPSFLFEPDDLSVDWEDHGTKSDTGKWVATYTVNGGLSTTSNAWDSYENQTVYAQKIFRYGGQLGAVYIDGPEGNRDKLIEVFQGSVTGGTRDEMRELLTDFTSADLARDDSLYNGTFIGKWYSGQPTKCGLVQDTMTLVQSSRGGIARIRDDLSLADCYVNTDGVLSIPTETSGTITFVVLYSGLNMRAGNGCYLYKYQE